MLLTIVAFPLASLGRVGGVRGGAVWADNHEYDSLSRLETHNSAEKG